MRIEDKILPSAALWKINENKITFCYCWCLRGQIAVVYLFKDRFDFVSGQDLKIYILKFK